MTRNAASRLAVVVVAMLIVTLAPAQEYSLKDYMPQTVGSKWAFGTTNRQGEATTITYEVDEARDFGGTLGYPILTKDAEGNLTRGSFEAVSEESLTLFGSIFVPRGPQATGGPFEVIHDPPAVFPGKLTAGQTAEATVKSNRGGQEMQFTIKLELAAVESVTVPKGTFADCLKLVFATTTDRGEMKRTLWYAKGVGLVKTESSGFGPNPTPRIAELTD